MITTIGYEKASLADFVATLKSWNVEVLIDIRERAQSRRRGFSKTSLGEAVREAGIEYRHFRTLGDPKEGREAARAGNWRKFQSIFSQVIRSDEGLAALAEITNLAKAKAICLMCYEADYLTCHRKMVAAKLELALGEKAIHLIVEDGQASQDSKGRVLHPRQSAAA